MITPVTCDYCPVDDTPQTHLKKTKLCSDSSLKEEFNDLLRNYNWAVMGCTGHSYLNPIDACYKKLKKFIEEHPEFSAQLPTYQNNIIGNPGNYYLLNNLLAKIKNYPAPGQLEQIDQIFQEALMQDVDFLTFQEIGHDTFSCIKRDDFTECANYNLIRNSNHTFNLIFKQGVAYQHKKFKLVHQENHWSNTALDGGWGSIRKTYKFLPYKGPSPLYDGRKWTPHPNDIDGGEPPIYLVTIHPGLNKYERMTKCADTITDILFTAKLGGHIIIVKDRNGFDDTEETQETALFKDAGFAVLSENPNEFIKCKGKPIKIDSRFAEIYYRTIKGLGSNKGEEETGPITPKRSAEEEFSDLGCSVS